MSGQHKLNDESILRSAELDEIIGRPPHWLVRRGISLFFLLALLILALGYFIQYPDFITIPLQIAANQPSTPVALPGSGFIGNIMVKEGTNVKENDTLFTWFNIDRKKKDVVLAPTPGTIEFLLPLIPQKLFHKSDVLIYINPINNEFQLYSNLDTDQAAKVKVGNKVHVSFKNTRGEQLAGNFSGHIAYIGSVPGRYHYYVKYNLAGSELQKIAKQVVLNEGLSGSAEILVGKKRLIKKLFDRGKMKSMNEELFKFK